MFAEVRHGFEPRYAFEPKARLIYAIITGELTLAFFAYSVIGLRFSSFALALPSISVPLVLAAAWAGRRANFPQVATYLEATTLTYLSGLAGWTLLYPGTVWALQYGDWWLAAADRALGFNFVSLYQATKDWPWAPVYHSFSWQAPLVILALTVERRDPWPFVLGMTFAMIATVIVYPFAPAIGPIGYYGLGPPGVWTPMIEALRDHGVRTIQPEMFVGMVSMPSFHASAGALIVWATWPLRILRWPFLLLNAAMIFSTVPFGQHYLVDVIGGLIVAWPAARGATWYLLHVGRNDLTLLHTSPSVAPTS